MLGQTHILQMPSMLYIIPINITLWPPHPSKTTNKQQQQTHSNSISILGEIKRDQAHRQHN